MGQTGEQALLCPACGYDLRAMIENRCPECGLVIDPDSLRMSTIAWVHRREIGRVRAYFRTVWQILSDRRAIRLETARPQSRREARWFALVTSMLLAIVALSFFIPESFDTVGNWRFDDKSLTPSWNMFVAPRKDPQWLIEAEAIWFAGAALRPVLPLCCVMLCWAVVTSHVGAFQTNRADVAASERDETLATYAIAPIVLLIPAGLLQWAMALMWESRVDVLQNTMLWFALASGIFYFLAIGGALVRAGQWHARLRHAGLISILWGIGKVICAWLVSIVLVVGLIPFAIGFVRIVFRSLLG